MVEEGAMESKTVSQARRYTTAVVLVEVVVNLVVIVTCRGVKVV